MDNFQKQAAELFHKMVQIERENFFGCDDRDKWLPNFQQEDAKSMCPPFMGTNYKRGGLVVIPINPGVGNEISDVRSYGDSFLYPIIHDFKGLKQDVATFYWNEFVPKFREAQMSYPIYKQMMDMFSGTKIGLDDICYFNFLPYRVKGNDYPKNKTNMSEIIPNCCNDFVKPVLEFLEPSLVVAFGKQVDIYIDEYWGDFAYQKISWNRVRVQTPQSKKERELCKERLRSWAVSK